MKVNSLGELEQQVMDILWDKGHCSVRDVVNFLGNRKLAYTTVATILQRLHNKGLVKRSQNSSGYTYSAKITKKSYSKNLAQAFLGRFINSFGDTAIASFAESVEKLPDNKREYFLEVLKRYDNKK